MAEKLRKDALDDYAFVRDLEWFGVMEWINRNTEMVSLHQEDNK